MPYVMLTVLKQLKLSLESKNLRAAMSKLTCPACGGYIDQKEQDKVEGNFYVCSNCFIAMYRRAHSTGDA